MIDVKAIDERIRQRAEDAFEAWWKPLAAELEKALPTPEFKIRCTTKYGQGDEVTLHAYNHIMDLRQQAKPRKMKELLEAEYAAFEKAMGAVKDYFAESKP
jgi:hypothetical protein